MKTFKIVALIVLIIGVFSLAISCEVMNWNECRRYHPIWYCASQGGR